jgi:hypothetical protein
MKVTMYDSQTPDGPPLHEFTLGEAFFEDTEVFVSNMLAGKPSPVYHEGKPYRVHKHKITKARGIELWVRELPPD